jgi:hypothetical protein
MAWQFELQSEAQRFPAGQFAVPLSQVSPKSFVPSPQHAKVGQSSGWFVGSQFGVGRRSRGHSLVDVQAGPVAWLLASRQRPEPLTVDVVVVDVVVVVANVVDDAVVVDVDVVVDVLVGDDVVVDVLLVVASVIDVVVVDGKLVDDDVVLVVASVVDVVVLDEPVDEDVVVVGVMVEVVDEDVVVVAVVVEVVVEPSGAHVIRTFLPADSVRAQAAPLNFTSFPRTNRALGAVMKARTVAWAPMWTVSPVVFTDGVNVLPRGSKVEASPIRTSSRTLMVDCVAPVTSIVACLPVRIRHTLYVPGARLMLAPSPRRT